MDTKEIKSIFLSGSSMAFEIACLFNAQAQLADQWRITGIQDSSIVLVCSDSAQAEMLYGDLQFFTARPGGFSAVCYFPSWEVLPFDVLSPSRDNSGQRLATLYRILSGERLIIVTTISALYQRILSPEQFTSLVKEIEVGQTIPRQEITELLVNGGYRRTTLVEEVGDVSVRGAVIDYFPPTGQWPIRLEMFDDCVESIRSFDSNTQRSIEKLATVKIIPVSEQPYFEKTEEGIQKAISKVRERASQLDIPLKAIEGLEDALKTNSLWPGIEHLQGLLNSQTGTFFDYLAAKQGIFLCDQYAIFSAIEAFNNLVEEQVKRSYEEGKLCAERNSAYLCRDELTELIKQKTHYAFDALAVGIDEGGAEAAKNKNIIDLTELKLEISAGKGSNRPLKPFFDKLYQMQTEGYVIAFVASQKQRLRKLIDLLEGYGFKAEEVDTVFSAWQERTTKRSYSNQISVLLGIISGGLVIKDQRLCLIYESDIFPELQPRRRGAVTKNIRRFIGSLNQLKEGDFVVHVDHGIGIYQGLVQIVVEGKVGDFLHLEYADGAKLYLPVENISKVQKYAGVEGKKPVLTKLGTTSWTKTKAKVEQQVAELAGQLINLYAQREIVEGFSFGEADENDLEFADTFAFEETPDQAKAIEEVISDMANGKPMDRLVCGDVGYGKTEVGIRAAYKAVTKGKQVAVLVPTTVLADQHYATFQERFSGFPVTIGCVSRFFSPKDNAETIKKLSQGKIDIIIGTHRLLSKDVSFKNLGLLIIDEEHRFGVAHKEKLKQYRKEIDVLTLTATPIPRTLHMSLMGIRDLSVIETPPCDRQVIQTYLAPYEPTTVREAILRELGRNGQVFYINNRVQNIAMICQDLRELVPEARIEFAHGQMPEHQLSKVMHRFLKQEIDVLVSTTIVESGLDIANANTIIIRKAENFGLAELYQLRGRVGRSSRRAYAYLLISNMHKLGPEARKRLEVLQSLDDLGVGFRLALQDMEIRGAGNLLGKDQSGQVNLVGFELYSKILKNVVRELKHKQEVGDEPHTARPVIDPDIKIGFPAHIPTDYIPDVAERLIMYQRLVELENRQEGMQMLEEIEDRFGKPPEEVYGLIELMVFRSLLKRAEIISASYRNNQLSLSFHPEASFDRQKLIKKVIDSEGSIQISPNMVLSVRLDGAQVESPIVLYDYLYKLLPDLGISLIS